MRSNTDKCILIDAKETKIEARVGMDIIKGSTSFKLLGETIENEFNFAEHVRSYSSQWFHAVARVSQFMNKEKIRVMMKSFITSQLTIVYLYGCFIIEGLIIE